ncbi:5-oxoprolinase subunit PxpA [Maribacter chungangensis]|uniref:5-oxoprolinase subunit PxpA n=1 Tax=Maribacter chungangensis TaxID=1069117 RepID=A0ABW3B496_9FLAO
MNQQIDINCDLGEGVGNEAEVLPLVSSCNIACGGHAGDEATMQWVVSLAKKHQVNIGAHPSYPDMANFGRVSMELTPNELIATVREQIDRLVLVCAHEGVKLHHVKAHGALYNDIAKGGGLAQVFLEAIEPYKSDIYLYVPAESELEKLAVQTGFKTKREAFGDRNYNPDLSLVSRNEANALIVSPKSVLEHLLRMVKEGKVLTVANTLIEIQADTYCIHGDTPNALQILTYLSNELPK